MVPSHPGLGGGGVKYKKGEGDDGSIRVMERDRRGGER